MLEMHGICCWWLRGLIFGFTWSSTLRPAVLESLKRCHGTVRTVTGCLGSLNPLDDTPSGALNPLGPTEICWGECAAGSPITARCQAAIPLIIGAERRREPEPLQVA